MGRVTGIGGIFFRSSDAAALARWYETHLGVDPVPTGPDSVPWTTAAGVTVFAPFAADSGYFPADRQFMVNFRVADLGAMLAQLRAAGIAPFNENEVAGIGHFAHILDPEGNAIEPWQPA